jgi:inner membrane protein
VPSAFTHGFAAVALSGCVYPDVRSWRFRLLAAASAALPDVDVAGLAFGIPYGSMFGHRGFTHSLFFAALWALFVPGCFYPCVRRFSRPWWGLLGFFFLVTASHGILDAFTNGGRGVAFFAPFSGRRYFFPWTPIQVSPIGVGRFLSARGLRVMESELIWVWLPFALAWLAAGLVRKARNRGAN